MIEETPLTLSLVIPAYNEQDNLAASVRPLCERLDREGIDYEVVVVNDNSSDATPAVAQRLSAKNPRIRLVDRTPPRGFGRAVRAGIESALGDVVVLYMADASDDPDDVVLYYREICNGYDCVFGSRFIKGSRTKNYPWFKLVVNRIVNKGLQLLFWTRFNDLTNSFKAYRSYVLRDCGPFRASHFNITIELSLSAVIRNYNIALVPISWQGRTWGSSNLHLAEMGRRYLSTLIKIYFEKTLIRDDIIAESVAQSRQAGRCPADLEAQVKRLERRLELLERTGAKGGDA
ncbi:glycosyltransferase family 2 protein [Fundidesulfovibrio butyratiphilus]